jgi:hypothetical protein
LTQVPPPVVVAVPGVQPVGGAGIRMTVFGVATSPVLVTVTAGVAVVPGVTVFAVVLTVPSLTMPEQVDSATTTVPPATPLNGPFSRPMVRPRKV